MKGLFIVSLVLGIWFIFVVDVEPSEDLTWEDISGGLVEVNAVWVDRHNPRIILAGSNRGVFKTEDGGESWQAVLFGANKRVNFLYVDEINKNLIYAACSNGLFFSRNQGRIWQQIYKGNSDEGSNCLSLIKLKGKELYLGTEAGLLRSQDNSRTWHRFSGRLGDLPILVIAADRINEFIYLATPEGAYRIKPQGEVKKIFLSRWGNSEDAEVSSENSEFDEEVHKINHMYVDPNKTQNIYLATTQGIFKSGDSGQNWLRFSDSGLLSRDVRAITVSSGPTLWIATKSGVFVYSRPQPFYYGGNLQIKKEQVKDRWQELSLRLVMQDIRLLEIDNYGNIYAGGDKGLFRSAYQHRIINPLTCVAQDITIQQIQQAAIKYAQVIDPKQIAAHRKLCRLKAILPDFSLDYNKTISTYNNSKLTKFTIGPRDWGISLKWSLDELIWSEQQRLIDSQVRLMIKLRQDTLDEVTRLYFERRRLQSELRASPELKLKEKHDRELRIEELTALLDGLTGGYLSKAEK